MGSRVISQYNWCCPRLGGLRGQPAALIPRGGPGLHTSLALCQPHARPGLAAGDAAPVHLAKLISHLSRQPPTDSATPTPAKHMQPEAPCDRLHYYCLGNSVLRTVH